MDAIQKLDCGITVYFGQSLQEVEKCSSSRAQEKKSRIDRPGVDKFLKLPDIILEFDSERLSCIKFEHPYQFVNAPEPYPEKWRNFDEIGGKRIFGGISRDEVLDYLTAWERRANSLGIEKVHSNQHSANQYSVSFDRNRFVDMIHVSMGSSRRTAGSGTWSDGWTLFFVTDSISDAVKREVGLLHSVSASRDEFNTRARRRE